MVPLQSVLVWLVVLEKSTQKQLLCLNYWVSWKWIWQVMQWLKLGYKSGFDRIFRHEQTIFIHILSTILHGNFFYKKKKSDVVICVKCNNILFAGLTWRPIGDPCRDELSHIWWRRCKEISLEWPAHSGLRNHDLGWNRYTVSYSLEVAKQLFCTANVLVIWHAEQFKIANRYATIMAWALSS